MDILSHGLWAGALSKGIKTEKRPSKWGWAAFWGMFPDLFAFAPSFVWLGFSLITGGMSFSDLPRPETSPEMAEGHLAVFNLATTLYQFSHSLVIFGVVVLLLWLWKKKFYFILLGWPLHILCDIPTHTTEFYPTPVFWPLSDWSFSHGFSWGQAWFMMLNYSLLLIVYLGLYLVGRRRLTKKK